MRVYACTQAQAGQVKKERHLNFRSDLRTRKERCIRTSSERRERGRLGSGGGERVPVCVYEQAPEMKISRLTVSQAYVQELCQICPRHLLHASTHANTQHKHTSSIIDTHNERTRIRSSILLAARTISTHISVKVRTSTSTQLRLKSSSYVT